MCTPMHIILPSQSIPASGASTATTTGALYLGSMAAVTEPALLRSHHISVLVQVVDAAWLPMSEKEGFICHRMNIDDAPSFDLKPFLEGACRSIDDALRCGRSVLVHCHQVRIPTHDLPIANSPLPCCRASRAAQPSLSRISFATVACHSTTPTPTSSVIEPACPSPNSFFLPFTTHLLPAESRTQASSSVCRNGKVAGWLSHPSLEASRPSHPAARAQTAGPSIEETLPMVDVYLGLPRSQLRERASTSAPFHVN
jgi:hypothetical protein